MRALCSDSGVDTVRFRWRTDNVVYQDFQRRPEGTIMGYRGESFVQTELGRVGAYPDGLVYMEGRAAAILAQDPDEHALASVEDVTPAELVARGFVRNLGADVGDAPARLGRIDLASELRFYDANEGSAFLHSLAALDVPWCKSRTDGRKGSHIETVSFHGTRGKSIYLRAYDKGVESGSHGPGTRIRIERQKRFRKDREWATSGLSHSDLRKAYLGREFAKLSELPNAVVCDVPEALNEVIYSDISEEMKEKLAGFLVVGFALEYNRSTWYNRHASLRDLGIFVDPNQVERLVVPIGQYLQAAASAWAA